VALALDLEIDQARDLGIGLGERPHWHG